VGGLAGGWLAAVLERAAVGRLLDALAPGTALALAAGQASCAALGCAGTPDGAALASGVSAWAAAEPGAALAAAVMALVGALALVVRLRGAAGLFLVCYACYAALRAGPRLWDAPAIEGQALAALTLHALLALFGLAGLALARRGSRTRPSAGSK
jgi:hypothetical protein